MPVRARSRYKTPMLTYMLGHWVWYIWMIFKHFIFSVLLTIQSCLRYTKCNVRHAFLAPLNLYVTKALKATQSQRPLYFGSISYLRGTRTSHCNTIFVPYHVCSENPEGTRVILWALCTRGIEQWAQRRPAINRLLRRKRALIPVWGCIERKLDNGKYSYRRKLLATICRGLNLGVRHCHI